MDPSLPSDCDVVIRFHAEPGIEYKIYANGGPANI